MSRYDFPSNEDQQPVTWLAGRAIYGAHLVVIVFVASLLVSTILLATRSAGLFDWLVFNSADVLRGQVWRVATYGLVNPPSLGFVIDMFMIVWFGRELEKFFGRRTFFILYGCLYLLPPLLFTVLGLRWSLSLAGVPGALALFTAFATLYPNAALLFGILAKWIAGLFIGIYALIHLSSNNWPELLALLVTNGFAFLFVRHAQGALTLPRLADLAPRRITPGNTAAPVVKRAKATRDDSTDALMAEMDELLDRIATSGIASLTPKERARLDAAREHLLKHPKHTRR